MFVICINAILYRSYDTLLFCDFFKPRCSLDPRPLFPWWLAFSATWLATTLNLKVCRQTPIGVCVWSYLFTLVRTPLRAYPSAPRGLPLAHYTTSYALKTSSDYLITSCQPPLRDRNQSRKGCWQVPRVHHVEVVWLHTPTWDSVLF